MGQTLKLPVGALKVVQPSELAVTISNDPSTMSPEDLAAIEAKYRSAEQPIMFGVDQLTVEPPPEAPVDASMLSKALGVGPAIGSTIGGIVGGPAGAGMGGAAGVGYESLIRNARELPGAVSDVARNLVTNPRATMQGFAEGAKEGAETAGLSAVANAAMEYGGAKAMQGVQNVAKAVYRGYLKPSLAGASIKKAQTIVNTAIEEGIPITQAGKERAERVIGELKKQVDDILVNRQHISRNVHGDIDLHDIAERVRQFARDKYYKAGRPVEDFEAAMRVADNIDAHPAATAIPGSPQPVNLTEANAAKRTLQESAGDRAFGVERTPAQEAEKRGAYELRQEIETRAPQIAPLNARESKLIDTAKALGRAIEREANHNALVGVKTMAAATAGGVEYGRTGDPWSAAAKALAIRYALAPERASKLAILTYRVGKLPGIAPASAARLALAALAELDQEAHEK